MMPSRTNTPTVYSKRDKRDVVAATNEQKPRLEKRKENRRAILSDTTSSSDSEAQPKKRKAQVKKGENNNSEIAFDLERESRPTLIEISSTATEQVEGKEPGPVTKEENGDTGGKTQSPKKVKVPINASTLWEVQKNGPARKLDCKRVPTRRYGIDVLKRTKDGVATK